MKYTGENILVINVRDSELLGVDPEEVIQQEIDEETERGDKLYHQRKDDEYSRK